MGMKVAERRIVSVVFEGGPRLPFDDDHDLARTHVADYRFPKLSEGDNATTMRYDLPRRATRVGQVLLSVGQVEEIECEDRPVPDRLRGHVWHARSCDDDVDGWAPYGGQPTDL